MRKIGAGNLAPEDVRVGRAPSPHDHYLDWSLEVELQGLEIRRMGERVLGRLVVIETQDLLGVRAMAGLPAQVMKAKQHVRRDRVAGGQGAVGPRLAARDQLLLVVRREEVATARAVVEAGVESGHQLARPLEVHPITGGLV